MTVSSNETAPAVFLDRDGTIMRDVDYCCPDLPGTKSERRKPAPGMIFEAQRDHRLDLARSYFIGDKTSDIECGRNAGMQTILVQTGYGAGEMKGQADWIARDLAHAAEIILGVDR